MEKCIIFTGTMSSGKSTLINALLGHELLHSANEATTACITILHETSHLGKNMQALCLNADGEPYLTTHIASAEDMRTWNCDERTDVIYVAGKIRKNNSILPTNLTLVDIPGPNNSHNKNHQTTFDRALQELPYSHIVHVLNATHLGVNDDRFTLLHIKHITEENPELKIAFVLNKLDLLDPEIGEDLEEARALAVRYLENIGFAQPLVFPLSARNALLARKFLSGETMTHKECAEMHSQISGHPKNSEEEAVKRIEDASGIFLLESWLASNSSLTTEKSFLDEEDKTMEEAPKASDEICLNHNEGKQLNMSMNTVEIFHNPFLVETELHINGKTPSERSELSKIRHGRLQRWVDGIFDDLHEIFNGEGVHLIFKGVESDYLDIKEAAERAQNNGFEVSLEWNQDGCNTMSADDRLDQVKKIFHDAQNHPRLAKYFGNSEVGQHMQAAFDNNFDVYVVAGMSAGKSTLVNAMLGSDLLPAANEATTATLVRIQDNDAMRGKGFNAKRMDQQGNLISEAKNVSPELLKVWNKDEATDQIDIEGDIPGVRVRDSARLVITDTPGPNNSQDTRHAEITKRLIQDSERQPIVLYVLNATQLGTNDDQSLLNFVSSIMKNGGKQNRDRIIFVVNKMDAFDPEKENIEDALKNIRNHLCQNGIENPIIYPISAEFARLMRIKNTNPEKLTQKENSNLEGLSASFGKFSKMDLQQYMEFSDRARKNLGLSDLPPLFLKSGLPVVELMIDEYIEKYAVPHRLHRAHSAFKKIFLQVENNLKLTEALNKSKEDLKCIQKDLDTLKERRDNGFNVKSYKNQLLASQNDLDRDTFENLQNTRTEAEKNLSEVAKHFDGQVSPQDAENILEKAKKTLQHYYDLTISSYELVFKKSQEYIKNDLQNYYKEYVSSLFEGMEVLNFDVMEGIKKTIQEFDLRLNVNNSDVAEKDVKVGERSTSTWYKPWTWFSKEDVFAKEKYVDLKIYWKKHAPEITEIWSIAGKAAQQHIQEGRAQQIERLIAYLDGEFQERFDALQRDIETKISSKEAVQRAIKEAEEDSEFLNDLGRRLDTALQV